MDEKKTEAIWSWNYNHGEPFPWSCKVVCPKCRGINTMEDFGCIHHVMHEKCTKCGHIQEMSLVRCLKER